MPMVYSVSLATAGNLTTGTSGTETETFFVKAGTRNVGLQSCSVQGKANAQTTISGIGFRVIKWGTASTVGTAIVPAPKDPGMQAAKATAASRPTSGTTRTNHHVFGCGKAGPGGFVAENPDSILSMEGSGAQSISVLDVSVEASLVFEFSANIVE